MKRSIIILSLATLLGACSAVRATGDSVGAVGRGTGDAISGTGNAIEDAAENMADGNL